MYIYYITAYFHCILQGFLFKKMDISTLSPPVEVCMDSRGHADALSQSRWRWSVCHCFSMCGLLEKQRLHT